MMDLREFANIMLTRPDPCIVITDSYGSGYQLDLCGMYPTDVLDSLSRYNGAKWEIVGVMAYGDAIHHDTGEPIGRVVTATVVTRDDDVVVMLLPDRIITAPAEGGSLPESARAFLKGENPRG